MPGSREDLNRGRPGFPRPGNFLHLTEESAPLLLLNSYGVSRSVRIKTLLSVTFGLVQSVRYKPGESRWYRRILHFASDFGMPCLVRARAADAIEHQALAVL
ncbi:hypothetical protein OSTOST_14640 [Ostertagia ostertagi]